MTEEINSETGKIDATTGVTLRLTGRRGDGSGHHKIKLQGSREQADLEQLAAELLKIDGLIATKISRRQKWIEVLYNQAKTLEEDEILQAISHLNYSKYEKK